MAEIIEIGTIDSRIYQIRGKRVLLGRDIAALYGVQTRILNQAVKRNSGRFPEDFMFQLSREEAETSRSQNVTLKRGANFKYLPYAFTEQGVAMLSSVLNSDHAIMINVQIMRAFVRIRNLVADNSEVRKAIQHIERRLDSHDRQIQIAFASLKSLLQPAHPQIPKKEYSPDEGRKMGFGMAT